MIGDGWEWLVMLGIACGCSGWLGMHGMNGDASLFVESYKFSKITCDCVRMIVCLFGVVWGCLVMVGDG